MTGIFVACAFLTAGFYLWLVSLAMRELANKSHHD